jgi:hypothetical protein
MTRFCRLLCIACVMAALAAYSAAQMPAGARGFPSEKAIGSWLLSGDPQLVAWGAHDTLIARDQYLLPDLLSLAGRWQPLSRQPIDGSNRTELSREQTDRRDAMAAVLDTLIQMKVPVPADTLRTLAPDFGNAVAILLSRMPADEAGPVALDLYRLQAEHTYALQYVSAALLAQHPPAGFAADLLANIKVRATVNVVLPGSGEFTGGMAGDCFYVPDPPRKDWPETGQYALSTQKSDGSLVVVAGVDTVYATREQSTHYLGDLCHMSMGVSLGSEQRLRLIAEMLSISPEAIPWRTDTTTQIEFRSQQQFDRDLLSFVEAQQAKYHATVTALADHNLLTASEAQEAFPALELKLYDVRGMDAVPVQALSNLPSHVEWSSAPF